MEKEWIIAPPWDGCDDAAIRWNIPPLVAQILYNRDVTTADQAKSFLQPRLGDLLPPQDLPGVEAASDIIHQAITDNQRIVLYGDYDVDGITGVAILWHLLKIAGANVAYYVPHRVEEGYGLNQEAVLNLAQEGADLIVSIDCGISAAEVATIAKEAGIKLIITDHHQLGSEIPDAAAIVHPLVGEQYANPNICGAGVAFKLAWAVAQRICNSDRVTPEYRQFLLDALPLAALGTIADVVPLIGENRIIARCGLDRIRECKWVGINALLQVAGLHTGNVSGTDVGFKIAPRINAAGRMGHARLAIDLLTGDNPTKATEIAAYLDEQNRARQSKERQASKIAREMVEEQGLDGDANRAIVLAAEDWHAGIIGIVASRLVDRYHKPTALISIENGIGQGSARSIPNFELHRALEKCSDHLVSHGGHAMAAGFKVEVDRIPEFAEAFVAHANNTLSGTALRPRIQIDTQVPFSQLDLRTVTALENTGPFGNGNAKPVLASDWVELCDEPRCVGRNGEHLQVQLRDQGAVIKGIAFGAASFAEQLKDHRRCRVAFEPMVNEFNGNRRVELMILDFKFPD